MTLLSAVLLGGCQPAAPPAAPPAVDSTDTRARDLMALAGEENDLATLLRLIRAAGLARELRADGPYTLLAPTDDAFRQARIADSLFASFPAADSLLASSSRAAERPSPNASLRDSLRALLDFHLVRGRVQASSLESGSLRVSTLSGEPLTFEGPPSALRVGGRNTLRVLRSAEAQNGMLYVLPAVLRRPAPDTTRGRTLGDARAPAAP